MNRSDYHALLAARMSEAELDEAVRERFKAYRLTVVYHTLRSDGSHAGFPDWLIIGRWLMVRELKPQNRNPTAAQRVWLAAFKRIGADAGVWKPADVYSGRIDRELRALAGLRVREAS